LLGIGAGLVLQATAFPLALVGFGAALLHRQPACFKTLLFLAAGSVVQQTHTRSMEHLATSSGMPRTAAMFLVGSAPPRLFRR
jgi:formate hydrogenlyase subunit 3/multisubunit Na+/H+ antiporter MnhD subunit